MLLMTDDVRALVRRLYRGILHREPDAEGLDFFAERLSRGTDVNVVLQQLMEGDEHAAVRRQAEALFVPPGHFYSPIVDTAQVRPAFERAGNTPLTLPGIEMDRDAMLTLWGELLPFLQRLPFPEAEAPGYRYFFNNPAFGRGDGSIYSAMLQRFRPSRLVEVGSGHSSACALDTIDLLMDRNVEVNFIEPYPRLLEQRIGDGARGRVRIDAIPVQKADRQRFDRLAAGDFLFIDSTHVMKTGSDVCHELFEVLPSLHPGVFIHFHDIFWPFEYGRDWVLKENRSWNEIYGLRAFLMYNREFEIVFFNDYFVRHCREAVERGYPAMLKNPGGSIWLRKK